MIAYWEGKRVRPKKEYLEESYLTGKALGDPVKSADGMEWLPVLWDQEEDPTFHKLHAIELISEDEDKVNTYLKIHNEILATRITCTNLEDVAIWCRGDIKGTKLPVMDRVIEIISFDGEYGTVRAKVGDMVYREVMGDRTFYFVMPYDIFNRIYKLAD